MKKILELYITFVKMAFCTFGGGYAMMPIVQREIIDKRGWATEEDVMNYYAIGQVTPGVIGINTATFVGCHIGGTIGGIAATLGFVTPSMIMIAIIATVLQNFMDIPAVVNAFAGIRACVFVLVLDACIKMWKSSVVDIITFVMCAAVVVCTVFFKTSPFLLVVVCGVAGIAISLAKARRVSASVEDACAASDTGEDGAEDDVAGEIISDEDLSDKGGEE